MTTTTTTTKSRTCRCGHDKTHHMVSAEGEYGFFGYLRLIIGSTPAPLRMKYRCRVCDEVFLIVTAKAERDQYR